MTCFFSIRLQERPPIKPIKLTDCLPAQKMSEVHARKKKLDCWFYKKCRMPCGWTETCFRSYPSSHRPWLRHVHGYHCVPGTLLPSCQSRCVQDTRCRFHLLMYGCACLMSVMRMPAIFHVMKSCLGLLAPAYCNLEFFLCCAY